MPVVLSTGRSWHGTQPVFDQLGLPPGPTVCSNGAVIVAIRRRRSSRRSPSTRGRDRQVEDFAPGTLIAVEEIGRGYRLNEQFPGGDLTGEMIIEDAEQLSSRPVTRVILRDPTRSEGDFIALAGHLGMHGVTYFVGWGAWLDIAPDGVNKATALAEVAAGWASAPPTYWRSVTAATTSRCCAGPAAGWRSVMRRPRCGGRRRRAPTGSPTAARSPSCAAGSEPSTGSTASAQEMTDGGRGHRGSGTPTVGGAHQGLADEQREHEQAPALHVGRVVAELGEPSRRRG